MNAIPPFLRQPILLSPHVAQRPWGGTRLRDVLGKSLPPGPGPFGESWELSDHPDGLSHLAEPPTGSPMTFGELLRQYPRETIGREGLSGPFPLLVKYIDAEGDLSVQVHPDDAWCRATGHPDRGKSECWYVMDCAPGAEIVFGYQPGVTEPDARRALADGTFTTLLQKRPIAPGDFIAIPARSVHAIMAGTLVCEVQQSSNTTFRLYDWDRQPPRQLHIEESMQVSEFDPAKLPPVKRLGPVSDTAMRKPTLLLSNEFFDVEYLDIPAGGTLHRLELPGAPGTILNVVAGAGTCGNGQEWKTGQTWFLPAILQNLDHIAAGPRGLRILLSRSREL